jgi:hypothetical protein
MSGARLCAICLTPSGFGTHRTPHSRDFPPLTTLSIAEAVSAVRRVLSSWVLSSLDGRANRASDGMLERQLLDVDTDGATAAKTARRARGGGERGSTSGWAGFCAGANVCTAEVRTEEIPRGQSLPLVVSKSDTTRTPSPLAPPPPSSTPRRPLPPFSTRSSPPLPPHAPIRHPRPG